MNLVVQRQILGDKATIGEIFVDGKKVAWTLEDVVRPVGEKVYGETAIPAGKYELDITESARFKRRLPLIKNVPGFEGIRIHAGNTHVDTHGCLLVGLTRDGDAIGKSQMALSLLQPLIQDALDRGEECWIEIRNLESLATPLPNA